MTMPKLLSLNTYNYRRGGSDAVFLDHDALFREAGWETAVFTMHHPNNEPSPWSSYFADELEFGHAYSIWKKMTMAGKVIYSWEARSKLARLLDKFSPDVAHAHCIYHHLSPSVLSLLHERGIPTVMTAHDLKLACPAYKMLNKHGICEKCKHGNLSHVILNRCIHNSLATSSLVAVESAVHKSFGLYKRNLDRVVTPSRFFREKLMEWGWPAEKLVYIPNFLDCRQYTPEYNPGKYFLYFGRLAPEKGVDTLIRAAAQAGVRLKVAGTGPYEETLRNTAAEIDGRIDFLGYCSGDILWQLIQKCRAVVLPSQWYENAPISILEAYASGKPVIGARIGGIPEMLIENETGYLYESGEIDELSTKLSLMHTLDTSTITSMGRAARDHVSTRFTPERYMSSMQQLYASLSHGIR
jgi:glycosyltransferase involved in cell wall biosynthesis